jgi:hypothetical protein
MATKPIGSVFLGDLLRNPFSSPPSSPPPDGDSGNMTMDSIDELTADDLFMAAKHEQHSEPGAEVILPVSAPLAPLAKERIPPPAPANVDPETALKLRILWLEALLFGPRNAIDKESGARKLYLSTSLRPNHTLVRDVADIQKRLDVIVAANDGLRQFVTQCKQLRFMGLYSS